MKQKSIEHWSDLVIESLVIQVVNFDGLEVLFRVKIPLRNQESLSQDKFLHYLKSTLILASS